MTESEGAARVVLPKKMWLPSGSQKLGADRSETISLGVIGPSGTGKSHLLWQLGTDPRYAGRVLVLMAEDSTATYQGADLVVRGIPSQTKISPLDELNQVLDEMIVAKRKGEFLPVLCASDSWSGFADYQQEWSEKNPTTTKEGDVNKFASYWDLGMGITAALAKARDHIGCDFLSLATTTPPPMPELCIQGKMTPRNFTRMHSVCLFLEAKRGSFDLQMQKKEIENLLGLTHVTVGKNHNGELDGQYVARFFTCAGSGEVPAKGHRALNITERADLPTILDKLHGREIGAPLKGGEK